VRQESKEVLKRVSISIHLASLVNATSLNRFTYFNHR
jgi:hypothetical protein